MILWVFTCKWAIAEFTFIREYVIVKTSCIEIRFRFLPLQRGVSPAPVQLVRQSRWGPRLERLSLAPSSASWAALVTRSGGGCDDYGASAPSPLIPRLVPAPRTKQKRWDEEMQNLYTILFKINIQSHIYARTSHRVSSLPVGITFLSEVVVLQLERNFLSVFLKL